MQEPMTAANKYDKMAVDVEELFRSHTPTGYPKAVRSGSLRRLARTYGTGLLLKLGLYERLVDAGIVRGWFHEFRTYWDRVLGGRPIRFHDFFYLYASYRTGFQSTEVQEGADRDEFLQAWQGSEVLYLLFGCTYLYALSPIQFRSLNRYVKAGDSVLEYGCGIAPITYSLAHYSTVGDLRFTIADIKQINSHFAKMRLNGIARFIEIEPFRNPLPAKEFDVCFMITVMEHLPNPLETVKYITASLKPKGIFVFDYILGDGDGLDTQEAVTQRGEVLAYLEAHYEVLEGKLSRDASMGTTVCRLKVR